MKKSNATPSVPTYKGTLTIVTGNGNRHTIHTSIKALDWEEAKQKTINAAVNFFSKCTRFPVEERESEFYVEMDPLEPWLA